MRQTKLTTVLSSLAPRERTRFRQFIWSDFNNRHKALRKLCDAVLAYAPLFGDSMDKRALFEGIKEPEELYNELKFNNLMSDLYERLLDFLRLERQQADPLEWHRQGTLALLERNLNKQAEAALGKYRSLHECSPQRSTEWYRHAAHIEEIAEILHSRQPRRADSPHLLRQFELANDAQTIEKLRLCVALRSRSSLAVIQSSDSASVHSNLQDIRDNKTLLAALPAANVYLAAYDLLETPSTQTFSTLTTALAAHQPLFNDEELKSLYQCALNYCIRCINSGQTEAYHDALALYRTLLERGLLLQNSGSLSQWTYKNIATTGLRSGELQWTEDFLNQYRDLLPPDERDNAFAFNLATLYFEKQDFSLALQTLQNVDFTDFTYQIGAKTLQLKIFFLIGEEEVLSSLLASSEQLLRRDNTLSTFGKTTNLNFLRMLRQVVKWEQQKGRVIPSKWARKRQELQEKMEGLHPLANKDWLLKVVERTV